ncbi:hypothetical protein F2Q70_00005527 [Brassica cretica]|uniref:RNase H type-1 domain-containing protein n=1 Tax=Brassica cretica TaxID=69181 RepID=A0A8S9J1R6_BRACR|nr:hypothetical protein F2Q70_00005527 [Brassica cretica]
MTCLDDLLVSLLMMRQLHAVYGEWLLKDYRWDFVVDNVKGARIVFLGEAEMMQAPDTPPIHVTSDRQVRNLLEITKTHGVRLCVSSRSKTVFRGCEPRNVEKRISLDEVSILSKDRPPHPKARTVSTRVTLPMGEDDPRRCHLAHGRGRPAPRSPHPWARTTRTEVTSPVDEDNPHRGHLAHGRGPTSCPETVHPPISSRNTIIGPLDTIPMARLALNYQRKTLRKVIKNLVVETDSCLPYKTGYGKSFRRLTGMSFRRLTGMSFRRLTDYASVTCSVWRMVVERLLLGFFG